MPLRRQRKDRLPPVTPEEIAVVHRLVEVGGTPIVGGPVRCPSCTCWGMAERLDRATLRFDYCCPSCAETWTLSNAAVRAAQEEAAAVRPSAVPSEPAVPWPAASGAGADGPVVRISWGEASATSATSAAPHPAR